MSKKPGSMYARLRELWNEDPTQPYAYYAAILNKGTDSVRAAAHKMQLKRPGRPQAKPQVIRMPVKREVLPDKRGMVAGSTRVTSPTNAGYRRLL